MTGLRLTYRPCCFLLGVSGGSRPAGCGSPSGGPGPGSIGALAASGSGSVGAWRYRGSVVRGLAASGSGSVEVRRSGVRRRRGPAVPGPCGPGAVGVRWSGVRRCRGSAVRGLVASGSGGAGSPGVRESGGPGLGWCGPGGFRGWGWVPGVGFGVLGAWVLMGSEGVRQTAVDGQGRRRGHRHTRHSCCAGEGSFDYSDGSQAAAGAGPAGGAGRSDGAGGHAE